MNRLTRLLMATLMLFMIRISVSAQGIVVETTQTPNVEAQINNALAALSLTPVTSGILIDRTIPLLHLEDFDACTAGDSVMMHYSNLDLLYRSMYAAKISGSTLISPQQAYGDLFEAYTPSSTVPIVINAMQYHRLDPDAIAEGTLKIQGNQLHHASGVNPAAAFLLQKAYTSGLYAYNVGSSVTFTLPAANVIGNLPIDLSQIYLDADDGQGYRQLVIGGGLATTYATEGVKFIKIKFKDLSGEEAIHYHLIVTKAASSVSRDVEASRGEQLTFAPCIEHPCGDITAANGSATIHYDVKLSCGGTDITLLKKPLIILDGIDLTWTENKATFDDLVLNPKRGLKYQDNNIFSNKTLGDILQENDFDVIFVDYHDHHTNVEDNAAAVEAFLEFVNGIKAANGSPYKNIMMGISMGGLVGKYCLRDMELKGKNHDVEKYFTFDSPLQGANIPLFAQGALQSMHDFELPHLGKLGNLPTFKIPDLPDPVSVVLAGLPAHLLAKTSNNVMQAIKFMNGEMKVLSSNAAKQMMLYNITDPTSTRHNALFQKMEEMGRPQQCEFVGISNGSSNGLAGIQEAGPGLLVLDLNENFVTNKYGMASAFFGLGGIFALHNILPVGYNLDIKAYSAPGVGGVVYNGTIGFKLLYGLVDVGYNTTVRPPAGMRPIDTAPGGTIGPKAGGVEDAYEFIDNPVSGLTVLCLDYCFIPTVSALDIRGVGGDYMHPNLYNTDFSTTGLDRIAFESGPTVLRRLENGSTVTGYNQGHVTMRLNNVSTLLDEAGIGQNIIEVIMPNRTFNYGLSHETMSTQPFTPTSTSNFITKSLDVTKRGKIWINKENVIAYIDQNNPKNGSGTNFDVTLTKDYCTNTPVIVNVRDGGELSIGEDNIKNTGRLIVEQENKLILGSGGTMMVDNKSAIIVKNNAIFEILSGGKLIIKGNGRLIVESGGNLIVHDGAEILLEESMTDDYASDYNGSNITLNGKLTLPDGRIKLNGHGYLSFDFGYSLNSMANKISFESTDADHVAFRFKEGLILKNKDLNLENAGYLLFNNIHLIEGAYSILNSKFRAVESINSTLEEFVYPGGDLIGTNINTSSIINTTCEDVAIKINGIQAGAVRSDLSIDGLTTTTTNKPYNLTVAQAGTIVVNNSVFTTKKAVYKFDALKSKTGVRLDRVKSCYMSGTKVYGYKEDNGMLDN